MDLRWGRSASSPLIRQPVISYPSTQVAVLYSDISISWATPVFSRM